MRNHQKKKKNPCMPKKINGFIIFPIEKLKQIMCLKIFYCNITCLKIFNCKLKEKHSLYVAYQTYQIQTKLRNKNIKKKLNRFSYILVR